MGCGCSARRKPSAGTVIGYLVTYPDGTTTPESQPFMSLTDAKIEVRQAGGGTIRKLVKRR